MKMNVNFKATLVAVSENKSSDGKNSYYKLAVAQGAECATIPCIKDVYDSCPIPFKNYEFEMQIGEYEGKSTYRVIRVIDIPSTVGVSAPPKNADK